MLTYRWNGEYWYADRRSLWKRVRQWFVWVGGWEKANGAGWQFRIPYVGKPDWLWLSAAPVSVFGHRATWYGWGIDVRFGWCSFTWDWRVERCAYLSPDGTPGRAFHWLWGTPSEVRDAVASRARVSPGAATTPHQNDDAAEYLYKIHAEDHATPLANQSEEVKNIWRHQVLMVRTLSSPGAAASERPRQENEHV